MTTFGFTPVVPPFAGAGQEESVVADYMRALEAMGGVRANMADYDDPRPLCYLVATGGTERAVLDLHDLREASVPGEPVLLVAHPGNNSLPASLEVLARLQQEGVRGRIVFLHGASDEQGFAELQQALDEMAIRSALHAARIGAIGEPSDWLVASSPDHDVVRAIWGPIVVPIPMEELHAAIDEVSTEAAAAAAADLQREATEVVEPRAEELTDVARVHVALRAIVDRHQLDAVTVRCFDLVMERSTSGCFALSELTDEGVIAGCEGDLVSTIGMLWANRLTGELPWMANPASLDVTDDSLVLAHCTVPRTLVSDYRLRSHFESGLGVGIEGTLPVGPVTLLRIGGPMLESLWLAEGELVSTGREENLCRTQARIVLTLGNVRQLVESPLGNHIVLVRGHHADALAGWWERML